MGAWTLTGGQVLTSAGLRPGYDVVIDGQYIAAVTPRGDCHGQRAIDVGGRLVVPGLVDLHSHGAMGHTFNDGTPEAIAAILREHARHGVTSVLATLHADPVDVLAAAIDALDAWMGEDPSSAGLVGIHLEGPCLSAEHRGAHAAAHLRDPGDGMLEALVDRSPMVRMVCLAPELPGAISTIRSLVARGVIVSAGHSAALGAEIDRAVEAGVTHVAHLWSSQSTLVRRGPWRVPGLLEASLASRVLTGEVIADGRHLPPELLRIAADCLGPRLCLVSDSTRAAGLPEGAEFSLGDVPCVVRDGVALVAGEASFAGSTTFLDRMVPVMVEAGVDEAAAVYMATRNPCRVLGVTDRGRLRSGAVADVAVLGDEGAWMTVRDGFIAYAAEPVVVAPWPE